MFLPIFLVYVITCNQLVFAKVIIIGAGSSGIAAASKLAEKNYNDFIILEAENRIGGRIFSTEFGENNKKVDLGAEWVHGQGGNVAYEMAQPLGLLSAIEFNMSEISFSHSSISNVNQVNVYNLIEYLRNLNQYLDSPERTSDSKGNLIITEIFKRQNPSNENYSSLLLLPETKSMIDWHELEYNSNEAVSDSWYALAPKGPNDFEDTEGINTVIWIDGGYHNILDILMGKNAAMIKERTHLNKEVARIYWEQRPTDSSGVAPQPGQVLVRCNDGTLYEADHVIVTTSLGVLKDKVHSMFRPSLPDNKLIAIKGLGFGPVDKIFLEFTEPWWSNTSRAFSFLWSEEDKSNFTFPDDGSKSTSTRHWLTEVIGYFAVNFHPNILCGWVLGDAAKQMELASHSEVLEGSEYLLRRFFGHQYNITKPIKLLRSSWFKNPHFRGSYSNRVVESNILQTNASMLAEPIIDSNGKPILLFAGEATNTKHRSTVHGAIETGWREVERLTPWLR